MKVVVAIVVVLIALAGVGLVLPTEYAIAKSVTIEADPAAVHEYVGELKKWDQWTPWQEEDPTMETTFGDTTTGVGAHQSWSGKEGEGKLTFTRCDPATGIAYDMAFIFEGTEAPAQSEMTYKKVDGGTEVTWSMTGDAGGMMPPVVGGYIVNLAMKSSIENMFEKGLNKLKAKVEGE